MLERLAVFLSLAGILAAILVKGLIGSPVFISSPYMWTAGLSFMAALILLGLSRLPEIYKQLKHFLLTFAMLVSAMGFLGAAGAALMLRRFYEPFSLFLLILFTLAIFLFFFAAYRGVRAEMREYE